MSITSFLNDVGLNDFEGHCQVFNYVDQSAKYKCNGNRI